MGYLTCQWLKGNSLINRRHSLEGVSVSLERDCTCDFKDVTITIGMTRKNRDYHLLRLTNQDIERLIPKVLAALDEPVFQRCMENAVSRRAKKV